MKQQLYERVAEILVERYHTYVDLIIHQLSIEGRPAFNIELTEEELLARWANPEMQRQIIATILQDEGSSGVDKYIKHMNRLGEKHAT